MAKSAHSWPFSPCPSKTEKIASPSSPANFSVIPYLSWFGLRGSTIQFRGWMNKNQKDECQLHAGVKGTELSECKKVKRTRRELTIRIISSLTPICVLFPKDRIEREQTSKVSDTHKIALRSYTHLPCLDALFLDSNSNLDVQPLAINSPASSKTFHLFLRSRSKCMTL